MFNFLYLYKRNNCSNHCGNVTNQHCYYYLTLLCIIIIHNDYLCASNLHVSVQFAIIIMLQLTHHSLITVVYISIVFQIYHQGTDSVRKGSGAAWYRSGHAASTL